MFFVLAANYLLGVAMFFTCYWNGVVFYADVLSGCFFLILFEHGSEI